MEQVNHPFLELRQAIRKSMQQFRYATDNSKSLINPEDGFAYAHNTLEVEAALTKYEFSLPTILKTKANLMTKQESLIQMGSILCASCEDPEIRNFAQEVVAYFIGEQMEQEGTIAELIAAEQENIKLNNL